MPPPPAARPQVRVFPFNGGHSRDVYHTKRMQRVFSVRFSGDGTYVFSGSDDMNVRVWKVGAGAGLGNAGLQLLQCAVALLEQPGGPAACCTTQLPPPTPAPHPAPTHPPRPAPPRPAPPCPAWHVQAEAAQQMGVTLPREKHKQAYNAALVNRYKHMPEVKRIARHRCAPRTQLERLWGWWQRQRARPHPRPMTRVPAP
jgi:hypothetical protein